MARIVFVTGDKGGVGKSFTARVLLDWYKEKGIQVNAFDTDKTNSTLYRFFHNKNDSEVEQLDTDDQGALDQFLNRVSESEDSDIFLVDCGARTLDRISSWMNEIGFFELSKEMGIKTTLAFVMGPEKDCVAILKDVSESFRDHVDYVIVKNLAKGTEFRVYDDSKTRDYILKDLSGIEIEIPSLFSKTAMEVDRRSIPFSVAREDTALGIAERSRIRTFQNHTNQVLNGLEDLWT